jgi:AcrR family transcriptional regulator
MLATHQSEPKKVDPRVRRTRQLLQQALMDLMREKSFHAITVQDIAGRATVNRVTFYAHFEDKHALLEYTVREGFRQRLRSRLPEGAPFSTENLALLIVMVCESLADVGRHCPPPHGQLEPLMEKQIKAELYEVLHAWLVALPPGKSKPRPTPDQAAMVASWAIYGAALQWSQKARPQPAAEFARQVQPMILAGLQLSAKLPGP